MFMWVMLFLVSCSGSKDTGPPTSSVLLGLINQERGSRNLSFFLFFLFFLTNLLAQSAQSKTIHIFGDSLFSIHSHRVAQELSDIYNWPTPRAIIKDYSRLGATVSMIQSQYYSASDDSDDSDDVKTAIINGGANDILLHSLWCYTKENQTLSSECKVIIRSLIADSFANLINQMYTDGVQEILVLTSYHMKYPNTLFNQAIDYSVSIWSETCTHYGCKLIDMRQYVNSFDKDFYWFDGSHPSDLGSRRIARLIYWNLN